MTLEELEALPKEILSAAEIAPFLGSNPNTIRWQAHKHPEMLGFPVIIMKSRVKIPKAAFIDYCTRARDRILPVDPPSSISE